QDLARAHNRDPVIRRTLALAHTGFGRLLRHRLIREQPNPDLSYALHEARHRHAAGFDLPVGDPTRLEHLQSEIPKSQLAAAPGLAGHAAALLLAVLHFLWHQHNVFPVETPLAASQTRRAASLPVCSRTHPRAPLRAASHAFSA